MKIQFQKYLIIFEVNPKLNLVKTLIQPLESLLGFFHMSVSLYYCARVSLLKHVDKRVKLIDVLLVDGKFLR